MFQLVPPVRDSESSRSGSAEKSKGSGQLLANPKGSIPRRTIRPKRRNGSAATADELSFDWRFERLIFDDSSLSITKVNSLAWKRESPLGPGNESQPLIACQNPTDPAPTKPNEQASQLFLFF
jgi:hypothetical protein